MNFEKSPRASTCSDCAITVGEKLNKLLLSNANEHTKHNGAVLKIVTASVRNKVSYPTLIFFTGIYK